MRITIIKYEEEKHAIGNAYSEGIDTFRRSSDINGSERLEELKNLRQHLIGLKDINI